MLTMWDSSFASKRLHRRLALLVDAFDASYQKNLIRYAEEACRQRRVDLVVIPGGILGGEARAAGMRNRAYERVRVGTFDGVILLGSTMEGEVNVDGLARLCESLAPLPVCCIGTGPSGVSRVGVDNRAGVRALLQHLIEEHRAEHIAFIGGPKANAEAQERFEAYREALQAAGIEYNPRLVVDGDFLPDSGIRAVSVLLEERGTRPDAIVAANDCMAIGAMGALAKQSLSALRNMPVCGFDNVDEASFAFPPLTTAAQPLAKMAEAAVTHLLQRLDGEGEVLSQQLPATLVIRKSCGCLGGFDDTKVGSRSSSGSLPWVVELMRRRDALAAALSRAAGGSVVGLQGWAPSVVESLTDALQGAPAQAFIRSLDNVLRHVAEQGGELWKVHDIVSELRVQVLPCLMASPEVARKAEDLLQAARSLVGDALVRALAQERLHYERVLQLIDICGAHTGACESEEELRRVLAEELKGLGFQRAFVVVLEEQRADSPGIAGAPCRLLFNLESPAGINERDDCAGLVPDKHWSQGPRCNWVLLPLFYHEEELGWMVMEKLFESGHCFEVLRAHVSSALYFIRSRSEH